MEKAVLESTTLLIAVLVFGGAALIATAIVRIWMDEKEFDVYFVKLFGLLFIGTLAVAIVFVELSDETRTGAYTILGTIAGYLAGSKVPSTSGGSQPADGGGGEQGTPKTVSEHE
jgi:hypothetical protein